MNAKKNSRYDLERKRIVFFQLGLLTSGAFTLAAFTYKSPVENDVQKQRVTAHEIQIIEEVQKEIPKLADPIPLVVKSPDVSTTGPTLNITQEVTANINQTSNTNKDVKSEVGMGGITVKTGDLDLDFGTVDVDIEIVEIPAKDAQFIGGVAAMQKFINENLNYPDDAIELNMQGRVYLSFVVERDGSVSNVNVERGVFQSIDREAARVVRSFPTWIPGEMPSGKVRTRVRVPINFTLQ
jgi:protein TonB